MQTDAPAATPEQLARLDEVLARSEFQVSLGGSIVQRYLDALRAWVWSWIVWLLEPLLALFRENQEAVSPILVFGLIAISLVIVIGGLILLRRLSRGSMAGNSTLVDFAETGRLRAADELARARQHAESGDPRQAIHHTYLAVLLRLDEREHLTFDGALTNRELLPRLTAAPELAEPFAALVTAFDRLWYGQQTCSPEEYAAFRELADHVWKAAGTVQPAGVASPVSGPVAWTTPPVSARGSAQ
jgi:uncharacterized protein YggT (Ycf19 family)